MRHATTSFYRTLLLLLTAGAMALGMLDAGASPVNPGWRVYTQPDGSRFTAQAFGDEHFSWLETQDGRPVVANRTSKWFEYAKVQAQNGRNVLQPSGLAARDGADQRTLSATLPALSRATLLGLWKKAEEQGPQYSPTPTSVSSTSLATTTSATAATPYTIPAPTRNLLIVLVNFSDDKIRSSDAVWSNKFFGAAAGTVNDYYKQTTLGKLQFVKAAENYGTANDGVVKVQLNYPNPNKGNTDNLAYKTVLNDALTIADSYVNFKSFDTDGNGYIDTPELQVLFVLAGYESAYDGIVTRGVLGHAWDFLQSQTKTYDGVYVSLAGHGRYVVMGEWHGDHEATIGVPAHELGHAALGLSDLKGTDHTYSVSNWCLMGSGGWAMRSGEQNGTTPVLMSAYSRVMAGIVAPTVVTAGSTAQDIVLRSAEKSTYNIVKIPTSTPNEYFLAEVRRDAGYDQGFRGALANFGAGSYGLALWHIPAPDANNVVWPFLVAANNMNGGTTPQEPLNRAAMYYPGNYTTFGVNTAPNSNTFAGTKTNIVLQNIALSGEDMTAQLSAFACTATSATNSSHVTAGRAYKTTSGFVTTYYANGSNANLGTSAFTSNVLAQTSAGYYIKGNCP
jgi:M6 family metalloprotease-like protein